MQRDNWLVSACTGEFLDAALETQFRDGQRLAETDQIRLIWLLALFFFCLYGALDFYMLARGGDLFQLRLFILVFGSLGMLMSARLNRAFSRDLVYFLSLALVSLGYIALLHARDLSGNRQGAILLLVVGIYMFSPGRFWLVCANGLICTVGFWATTWLAGNSAGWIAVSYLAPANLLACLVLSRTNRLQRLAYAQRQQLAQEIKQRRQFERALKSAHKRNRDILYNALPRDIARQLQFHPEKLPVQGVADATVLFADIVGFSELSRQVSAERLIEILNALFTRFDANTADCGLEKIKTIGDAYLAVAGAPRTQPEHCLLATKLALAMNDSCEKVALELQQPLQLRIGLHCGPLVAGVIGRNRFAYDIWGETVNIASRVQDNAKPGEVLVSQTVRDSVANQFSFGVARPYLLKGCGEYVLSCVGSRGGLREPLCDVAGADVCG